MSLLILPIEIINKILIDYDLSIKNIHNCLLTNKIFNCLTDNQIENLKYELYCLKSYDHHIKNNNLEAIKILFKKDHIFDETYFSLLIVENLFFISCYLNKLDIAKWIYYESIRIDNYVLKLSNFTHLMNIIDYGFKNDHFQLIDWLLIIKKDLYSYLFSYKFIIFVKNNPSISKIIWYFDKMKKKHIIKLCLIELLFNNSTIDMNIFKFAFDKFIDCFGIDQFISNFNLNSVIINNFEFLKYLYTRCNDLDYPFYLKKMLPFYEICTHTNDLEVIKWLYDEYDKKHINIVHKDISDIIHSLKDDICCTQSNNIHIKNKKLGILIWLYKKSLTIT